MRLLIFILTFFVIVKASYCQNLHYYVIGDSLVGVKDEKGKIIIPAIHRNLDNAKNNEKITAQLINLPPKLVDTTRQTWGLVYNRKGEVLYAPYFRDNGPDGINEGMARYVHNNKIGFVNRAGKIVIQAQWDFVSVFDYGIAAYCNGCTWDFSEDREHPRLKGGTWGYVNSKGEKLEVIMKRKNNRDQIVKNRFLPYQFSYTAFEKAILDSFDRLEMISKAFFVNHYSPLDSNERILKYEIIERPSAFSPYYHVRSFLFSNERGFYGHLHGLDFFVSRDGRKYYFDDYSDGLVSLDKWLKKYIEEARSYLKKHPEALYKF